jgi:hypothetical protein
MSLSKKYWAPREKHGTRKDLYEAFEAWFATLPVKEAVAAEPAAKAPMVRKTAEEKDAEKAAKAAKKAAEKAEKDAEKAARKAATPAKAIKASAKAAAPAKAAAVAEPAKAAPVGVKPGPKKAAPKPVEEWTCPADGNVYPWPYKGKNFLRNTDNQVWEAEADGSCGDWAGVFIPAEDRIDESAADPFADEE